MSLKINKYLEGYRNKYSVDYCKENSVIIHLFDFDEKEVFNTGETGTSSFYRSGVRNLLEEFKVYEKVKDKLDMEKKSFERLVIHAVEDFYKYEFKDKFSREQYRKYLRKKKEAEIASDMIYYEEEYNETFSDEEHFKEWYINIINYNYNTKFTLYNEAKRHHKSEALKKLTGNINSNNLNLTNEEIEIFNELFRIGFTKLAKKYHPDVTGSDDKMRVLNTLKDKIKGN